MKLIIISSIPVLAALAFLGTGRAQASQMTLVYTDTFTTQDGIYLASGASAKFAANTPFTLVANFDTITPAFHLPGFNAYVPTSATLTVGGKSYSVTDADVSIFDPSNPFNPNLYAVGFIQNPALDQAGFVADFSGATPGFLVGNIVPTTLTGYNGTGFASGSGIPPGCSATGTCTGYNNTPLHLLAADGSAYLLALGNRSSGPVPAATASIMTPEPAAAALLLIGLAGLAASRRRR